MADDSGDATRALLDHSRGDDSGSARLLAIVYDELRQLASRYLARERPDHTLQPTALVHEAFLRLIDQRIDWNGRTHFFAVAARTMRRVLVLHAEARGARKRGGDHRRISVVGGLDEIAGSDSEGIDVIALDEVLSRLEAVSPRQSRIVELRVFGGMSVDDIAESLEISPRTVRREWTAARAWLLTELDDRHD